MAGTSQSDSDDEITGINITPLVDIMLVLLIIFMVTANFANKKAINVDLPKAATGEDSRKARSIGIMVDKESRIYLDGTLLESDAFRAKVREIKNANSIVSALIAADKVTPHGTVIHIIDLLRLEGIESFSLNIDPEVAL